MPLSVAGFTDITYISANICSYIHAQGLRHVCFAENYEKCGTFPAMENGTAHPYEPHFMQVFNFSCSRNGVQHDALGRPPAPPPPQPCKTL